MEVSKKDEQKIEELSKDNNLYQKLSESFAPEIYGYDKIKLAILIQMVGGVEKKSISEVKTRGNIHILLIGDPSSGKTKLLKIATRLINESQYISGRHSNIEGLTGTIKKIKEKYKTIPGGLSNFNFIAIDQLDILSSDDLSNMYEALENQEITVCKYELFTKLQAKCSMLAAASPKFGRFDPYDILARQINLPPSLISRFDFIFTMNDKPNKKKDYNVANTVLFPINKKDVPIKHSILKKYLATAKKIIPNWEKDAKLEIRKEYLILRSKCHNNDGLTIPIGPTQIEALIRISEGIAKLRLSKTVEKKDAIKAIELILYSFSMFIDDNHSCVDIDKLHSNISAKNRKSLHYLKFVLEECEYKIGEFIPVSDIVETAKKFFDMDEIEVEEAIDRLKKGGDIYEPRRGIIRRL